MNCQKSSLHSLLIDRGVSTTKMSCDERLFQYMIEQKSSIEGLEQLPPHLVVYAIEGKNFAMGTGLNPEVESAIHDVVERLVCEASLLALR